MRSIMLRISLLVFALLCISVLKINSDEDLYKVLGVSSSSSKKEIKAAYKKLAMEWHPDRNDDPNANERFMKINEAYETLIDPEKKEEYDRFGKTSASGDQGRGQQQFQRRSFFGNFGNFHFDFGAGSVNDELIEKFNINLNSYERRVLPDSSKKPYLLYVYADFCMSCMNVDRIFDKIVNDMEHIGMGIGTVHANIARGLTHRLKIQSVPSIVMVIDERLKYMSGVVSPQAIRDFVRSSMPTYTVQTVSDDNSAEFLNGWHDNKIRMLFCDSKPEPSLRYLLPAYANRFRFVAGYVNVHDDNTFQLQAKYHIQRHRETLLMFNENVDHPTAHVAMNVLPRSTIEELMEANKHLQLPRLSSQELLDELCPAFSSVRSKKLCAVLLAQKTVDHVAHIDALRAYAQSQKQKDERVKYTYVYHDTQAHFVEKFVSGKEIVNSTSGALKLAVMWRKDKDLIYYDWLPDGWFPHGPQLDDAHAQLSMLVSDWLQSKHALPHVTDLNFELYNEHGYSLIYRIFARLVTWSEQCKDYIFSLDEVSLVMVVTSVACLAMVYGMFKSILHPDGDATPAGRRQHGQQGYDFRMERSQQPKYERPVVNITPLVASNFHELVLGQPAGVRLLVVFVDDERKMKLINHFAVAVKPFSRSSAFRFAFAMLEDHVDWFRDLLRETIGYTQSLANINQANCLGTVLALNGPRKSYSIYHAHVQREEAQRRADAARAGQFLGFDDASDSESSDGGGGDAQKLFEADLLAGLGTWLERLCEGTVQKFRIEKWPEMK